MTAPDQQTPTIRIVLFQHHDQPHHWEWQRWMPKRPKPSPSHSGRFPDIDAALKNIRRTFGPDAEFHIHDLNGWDLCRCNRCGWIFIGYGLSRCHRCKEDINYAYDHCRQPAPDRDRSRQLLGQSD